MSNTTIQLRKSGQTGNTPADLAHGELAINYADGKLFYKNGVGIKSIENQKTFSTINANNSLIIATTPTDILSLAAGSNILIDANTVTKTVTISVPGGSSIDTLARERAQAAYDEANTQNVINQTQNTWITNTNTFAQAGYNTANTAAANTVYLQSVNDLQNTNISSVNTLATAAYAQANNASGNTVALQAVNTVQNTNITAVNTFAQAAYNQANTAPTQLQTAGIRTNASYFPLFVDSNNAVLTAESIYSTGAGITINPSTNTITATTFSGSLNGSVVGASGSFSSFVDLTGDDDYIEWGASNDARMMYNGTANTINLQLYSDVISFKVVDNANTADRFIFYKANGDLQLVTGNLIFRDGTVQRTEALTAAQAAFNSANAGVTLATAAFGTANNASGNTVAIQAQMSTTNTNVSAVNTFAFMASFTANSGWTAANSGVSLATAAFGAANTAAGNTVALQAQMNTTNTNITSVNTFAGSAFNSANAGVTLATAAYGAANNASGNTVALQAQMTITNTNITSVNTFTGSAFNSANAGVTLATAAYSQANNASGNTVALQAQMTTTNTNITAVNTFAGSAFNSANAGVTLAQSAYNTANLKFNTTGGTITGNVTIQNNLVVQGNLSVLGNSTTISTSSLAISDPLIFLANGNIVTDTVDVGVVGHYGGPSGETHTGIFRDPNLKEWIIFQGYTTQVQSNNLINIADPSFAYANLYANVVKSNLISTYAVVNGLNVFSTMSSAFASANAGVTLATAAYAQANNASGNTVAMQAQMTTTNTNVISVNTFAGAAFNSANAGVTLATAAYGQANNASGNTVALQAQMTTTNTNVTSVNTFAGAAFNSANAGVTLATAAFSAANTAAGNTVALQAQMTTTNTNVTSVNTFTQAAFNSANAGVTLATAAFTAANTAASNTVALQTFNNLQNTNITSVNTFAQAGFNKANGAVQTGFTTIAANSINITPTSNTDTLTITAGNNISISACTTTRTITIASTASGGGGGGGTLTYNTSPPATGNTVGDRWVDSEDGTLYTYINDGNSSQWVDFSTSATLASVGGGSANAILYQAAVGNTTFTSVGTQGQLLTAGIGGVPVWAAQSALSIANTQITGLITSGQIATVANTQITGLITSGQIATVANTQITGLITSGQIATVANTQITGRVTSAQIANTAVTTGTYGGSTAIPVITIDQQGRITGAANAAIQTGTTITDETLSGSTYYPVLTVATSGSISVANVSSTKLTYVPSTGTLSSTVITSTSDEKLKTNITTIQNPIDTIKQLRGVEYNWKDNGEKSMGVVAQEVEKILPYLVVESNDGKSVMYQNMIGLLIEAIKEQQKQIDELRGKLNAD